MKARIEHTLSEELDAAVNLARTAGSAIMDFYNSAFIVEEKLGADNYAEPVTEADRRASEIIVSGLQDAFPADGILSEELADTNERLEKRRVWIIDPIDGTLGFVNREGEFAVQIGLASEGESMLGIVYEPLTKRLFWAIKGAGAWLETPESDAPQRLQVSSKTTFTEMTVAASRSHYNKRQERLRKHFRFKKEIRRGSVGIKVGLLATQECDIYVNFSPRTKHWDTCAPQIILEEAGGTMTDLFGEKIIYNTRDVQNHNGVVSSNGVVHNEIIRRVKPLLTEFGRYRVKIK